MLLWLHLPPKTRLLDIHRILGRSRLQPKVLRRRRRGQGRVGAEWRQGGPVLEARKVALVEDSAFRDDDLLGGGVVELPALVAIRVPDEDALLHVQAKRTTPVLLHMHIQWLSKVCLMSTWVFLFAA